MATELVIPEGLEEIERGAFEECTSLKSVRLPDSLAKVGDYAFYTCTSLEKVLVSMNTKDFGSKWIDNTNAKVTYETPGMRS